MPLLPDGLLGAGYEGLDPGHEVKLQPRCRPHSVSMPVAA